MTESKFCTKCGAPLVDIDESGEKICSRLYEYGKLHPTLPSVSHAVLPRKEKPVEEIIVNVGAIKGTYDAAQLGRDLGLPDMEVPPSPRLCTACEKPNLGWCAYCKRTFCAKQECMLQHESVCPGFKKVMTPEPKIEFRAVKLKVKYKLPEGTMEPPPGTPIPLVEVPKNGDQKKLTLKMLGGRHKLCCNMRDPATQKLGCDCGANGRSKRKR